MNLPVQIILRGMPGSPALESAIREKATRFEHVYDGIISCRVAVELAGKHKSRGNEFRVSIVVKLPGEEVVVNRDHDEDVYIAIRDAIDAARRKIEEFAASKRAGRHRGVEGTA
jgi:ribosomal subunit interface protein